VAQIIIDGTYIDIPKSSNFRVLRQSFCLHKHKHLVKPIMLVAPDGYIIEVYGPYFSDGRNNDASCLINELDDGLNDEDRAVIQMRDDNIINLRSWLSPGDVVILDRGYRDAIRFLEQLGINHWMPPLLQKKAKQLPTEDANYARLITKTRWIVEARNGHIKSKFKFFNSVIPMAYLANIGDFFRICCAILNAFSPPILMSDANPALAREILDRAESPNEVQMYIDEHNLRRQRARWMDFNSTELPNFPRLDYEELRDLTVGVYQIKLAKSYVHDK
jgi:hypothetical protein